MEIMINNVVLMFSPTDEKTPYEQGENRTVRTVQSVAARSMVHKFLKRPPAWIKLERVLMAFFELYVWPRSVKDLILQGNRKKKIPWKLSITIEKEYILFKRELTVLTEVVQWVEAFIYSSNVFGVQGSNPQGANFSWHYTCVVHIASNITS